MADLTTDEAMVLLCALRTYKTVQQMHAKDATDPELRRGLEVGIEEVDELAVRIASENPGAILQLTAQMRPGGMN